jgi:hypothetical protein
VNPRIVAALACGLALSLSACDGSTDQAAPSPPPLTALGPSSAIPVFDPGLCAAADALRNSLDALPKATVEPGLQAALGQVRGAGQDLVAAVNRSCPKASPPASR